MTYEYECEKCGRVFDVVKRVQDMDLPEPCIDCENIAKRNFVPKHLYFSGTQVQHAEYNPGLGQVVKNKHHRSEIAKQKGLVEIGNDSKPESLHKQFDSERAERRRKAWEEV